MRIVAIVMMLAFPAFASAQLRFTQPSVDLRELRGGPSYAQRFDFINDSTQPIEITDFRLGCGCLQPVLDKRIYQAGEKGTLVMNVRTLGQQDGPRTWRAHVQYRHGDKLLETGLVVAAVLRSEVTVEPSILAMTIETTLRQEVTIRDLRATPMKIVAVLASSPALRVMTQPIGNGATKVIIEVSATSLKTPRQEETLNIYSDDPNYRHLQVPITLMKTTRADVSATPERVEIIGAGSQLVRLRSASDLAVRIDKAEANHPGIKCTWAAGPGNDTTLKISADASAQGLPMSTTPRVHISFAQPAGATLIIPINWRKE